MSKSNKESLLLRAHKIVDKRSEEKTREYGPFDESMQKSARLASILTNKEITTEDFYKCMIALKMSRMAYNIKEDTMLDAVAYISALNDYNNGR